MEREEVAERVLDALGGRENIQANGVCATRLRVQVRDPSAVREGLINKVPGVLGCIRHGDTRVEIVFGPMYIQDVYRDFTALTGLATEREPDFYQDVEPISSINIKISPTQLSPARRQSYSAQAAFSRSQSDGATEASGAGTSSPKKPSHTPKGEIERLKSMLDHDHQRQRDMAEPLQGPKLLVINGPNINMLGIREPDIYGKETFASLIALCKSAAKEYGFSQCECYQSNHEGDLVDKIQEAYQRFDGIVMNPGAYTHTSVAILDALKAVSIPCVEVHISKVDEREDFRQVSYVRQACFETVTGLGIEGYRKAIGDMAEYLEERGGHEG